MPRNDKTNLQGEQERNKAMNALLPKKVHDQKMSEGDLCGKSP